VKLSRAWYGLVGIAYDLVLKLNPRKLGAHAVVVREDRRVLLLRSRYANTWQLPGGGVSLRENLDATVVRECREELGLEVEIEAMTGFYYQVFNSAYVGVFRCRITTGEVRLSHEHSEYRWATVREVPARLRSQVEDALVGRGNIALRTLQ
jgi:8-oxo-dGTP diphosphatase